MSDAEQERTEFHKRAASAMAQRQIMLALLDLPRDIADPNLIEQLGGRVAATARVNSAAADLLTTATPEVETGGRTWRVDASKLRELRAALEAAPVRRILPTE